MASGSYQDLRQLVSQHMPAAQAAMVDVVTAVTGLLGCAAYADHEYTPEEEQHLRTELSRMRALSPEASAVIIELFSEQLPRLAQSIGHECARVLRENCDETQRLEVLEALVDLAAIDDSLNVRETNLLRRLTTALGLSQHDYNQAQARHREKLTVLK